MTEENDTPTQPSADIPALPMSIGENDRFFAAQVLDPPAAPGELGRIDRFAVIREVGAGGMGIVFESRHPVTGAPVALKVLRPELADNPSAAQRFLTEARHMSRLSHRNILKVLDVSSRAQGPYYVMPFMPEGSLGRLLAAGNPLEAPTTLRVARDVAEALAHAHQKGIIHRDLKPANVLLDEEGHACLADFGMVRTLFNDSHIDIRQDQREGTPAYMSPGVAAGAVEDTRCDIYSFGATLYEMLTGQTPYDGHAVTEVFRKILAGPPTPILTLNRRASAALAKISEGAMARELRDRYAKMEDVVADLDRVEKGKPPLGPHGHEASVWRRRWPVAALVALAIGGGIAMHNRQRAAHAMQQSVNPSISIATAPRLVETPVVAMSSLDDAYSLPPPPLESRIDGDGHRVVNLMPLIDVSRDGLTGAWRMTDKGLSAAKLPEVKGYLRIPYDPPEEYDFRIEFTRTSGDGDLAQIMPGKRKGEYLYWGMGMREPGEPDIGFDGFFVDRGDDASKRLIGGLTNGHRYASVVQIRKNSVAAIFDDKKIVDRVGDPRDMRSGGGHGISGSELILRTSDCTAIFHSIEIIELSASGKPWPHASDDPERLRLLKINEPIRRARFSNDGGSLFCIAGGHLTIWDVEYPRQIVQVGTATYDLSVRADGKYAVAHHSPAWIILSAEGSSPGETFTADSNWSQCGDFSADGSVVAVAVHGENAVRLFDGSTAPEFKEIHRLQLPKKSHDNGEIESVRFSPDGQRLAVGPLFPEDDPAIRLFDVKTGNELWHANADQRVKHMFDPTGNRILGMNGTRTATVWDARDGHTIARWDHRTNLADAAFSIDGKFLFTADSDPAGSLHVWDLSTGGEIERFHTTIPVNGIALSKDGHRLLAACEDWTVRLFDADTGKQLHRYIGHDKTVNCVAFSPGEKTFASGSDDRTVRLWNLNDPTTAAVFNPKP